MASTASSIPHLHDKIQETKGQRTCSGFCFLIRETSLSHKLYIRVSLTFHWQKQGLTPTRKQITGKKHEVTGIGQDQL